MLWFFYSSRISKQSALITACSICNGLLLQNTTLSIHAGIVMSQICGPILRRHRSSYAASYDTAEKGLQANSTDLGSKGWLPENIISPPSPCQLRASNEYELAPGAVDVSAKQLPDQGKYLKKK
jgi:hypothetical protein